jgi:hypothetical protein
MQIRLSQLDGKLPNLALMKLSAWHRARGDSVHYFSGARAAERDIFEPDYDRVYGSAIFKFSEPLLAKFQQTFPAAIIGGTGTGDPQTVESLIGQTFERYDYSITRDFDASIGFTQRGCRLACKFCVVPTKEGKPRSVNTIADIWRGAPHPKHLHFLDNDFFGQPEPEWRARIAEIRDGGFKVSFTQGINVRAVTPDVAAAIASIQYRDDGFTRRRLYTAWDNLKDEEIFFRGVDLLEAAGVPPSHLMAFMLVGFDKRETPERMFHRFNRMVARGIRPYPMVYDRTRRDLKAFARWVITGLYRAIPFDQYDVSIKRRAAKPALAANPSELFRGG